MALRGRERPTYTAKDKKSKRRRPGAEDSFGGILPNDKSYYVKGCEWRSGDVADCTFVAEQGCCLSPTGNNKCAVDDQATCEKNAQEVHGETKGLNSADLLSSQRSNNLHTFINDGKVCCCIGILSNHGGQGGVCRA